MKTPFEVLGIMVSAVIVFTSSLCQRPLTVDFTGGDVDGSDSWWGSTAPKVHPAYWLFSGNECQEPGSWWRSCGACRNSKSYVYRDNYDSTSYGVKYAWRVVASKLRDPALMSELTFVFAMSTILWNIGKYIFDKWLKGGERWREFNEYWESSCARQERLKGVEKYREYLGVVDLPFCLNHPRSEVVSNNNMGRALAKQIVEQTIYGGQRTEFTSGEEKRDIVCLGTAKARKAQLPQVHRVVETLRDAIAGSSDSIQRTMDNYHGVNKYTPVVSKVHVGTVTDRAIQNKLQFYAASTVIRRKPRTRNILGAHSENVSGLSTVETDSDEGSQTEAVEESTVERIEPQALPSLRSCTEKVELSRVLHTAPVQKIQTMPVFEEIKEIPPTSASSVKLTHKEVERVQLDTIAKIETVQTQTARVAKSSNIIVDLGSLPPKRKPAVENGTTQIGSFILDCILAKGIFGTVFRAHEEDNGKVFVLKETDKRAMKGFYSKYKFSPSLYVQLAIMELVSDCEYVTKLFCSMETKSHLYMVTEYAGRDLNWLMSHCSGNRLQENFVGFVMAQLSCALNYLHAVGIIHRCVTPDNVYVGCKLHVTLGNFSHSIKRRRINDKGRWGYLGCYPYSAPELPRGELYDHGLDWWNVGVMAYQALVGHLPFCSPGDTIRIRQERIVHEPVTFPTLRPAISKDAHSFISSLLEKDPDVRLGGTHTSHGLVFNHAFFKFHGIQFAETASTGNGWRVIKPSLAGLTHTPDEPKKSPLANHGDNRQLPIFTNTPTTDLPTERHTPTASDSRGSVTKSLPSLAGEDPRWADLEDVNLKDHLKRRHQSVMAFNNLGNLSAVDGDPCGRFTNKQKDLTGTISLPDMFNTSLSTGDEEYFGCMEVNQLFALLSDESNESLIGIKAANIMTGSSQDLITDRTDLITDRTDLITDRTAVKAQRDEDTGQKCSGDRIKGDDKTSPDQTSGRHAVLSEKLSGQLSKTIVRGAFSQSWINDMLKVPCAENELLSLVVCDGNTALVESMLKEGIQVNAVDGEGNTPLAWAVQQGNVEMVELLLRYGADPAMTVATEEMSIAHLAIMNSHTDVIATLLAHLSKPNLQNKHGESLLYCAALVGHTFAVKMLIDRGAKVSHLTNHGASVIHACVLFSNIPTLTYLLDEIPDVSRLLNCALTSGRIEFEKKKIDITGWTALHMAAAFGYKDAVVLLVERGAKRDAKTAKGKTALDLAWGYRRDAVIVILRNGLPKKGDGERKSQGNTRRMNAKKHGWSRSLLATT